MEPLVAFLTEADLKFFLAEMRRARRDAIRTRGVRVSLHLKITLPVGKDALPHCEITSTPLGALPGAS